MNKIGFSIGAMHTWTKSLNKRINFLKQLPCNAIEIGLSETPDLDKKISKQNIKYLKSLDYVSLHSPFYKPGRKDFFYDDNKETKEILDRLQYYYDLIEAKALIIHPNQIKNYDILKKYDMNFCLENMPKKRNINYNQINSDAKEHNFNICLDTAHVFTYNNELMPKLIKTFKNKIYQVHLSDRRYSNIALKEKDHQQLLGCKDLDKFKPLKDLNCPMIIEIDVQDKVYDLDNFRKEYQFVKNYFS